MSVMKSRMQYVTVEPLLKLDCHYNLIIGERSNGKSYSVLKYALQQYYKDGSQLAYVRRNDIDIKGNRAKNVFTALLNNDEVRKITNGYWDGIQYFRGCWYLTRQIETGKEDEDGNPIYTTERSDDVFAWSFALNTAEHDKSTSYPRVRTIMFDEFISRIYLTDEFVLLENLISTIARDRDDIKIFMCGNTINKYAPYYREMGLRKIKQMQKGDIDVYQFGEKGNLRVAVYFSDSPAKTGKASDVYFAFDNPRLNMITGKGGGWEIDVYPHLPMKYRHADVLAVYYVNWDGDLYQCNVVCVNDNAFTYIHQKTTEIKDPYALRYSTDYDPNPYHRRNIMRPQTKGENRLLDFFKSSNVYYQDNEVGDAIANYLDWCRKN